MKFLIKCSVDTFRETRDWIPLISILLIITHCSLYLLNQYLGNSDIGWLRAIIITSLVPFALARYRVSKSIIDVLERSFLPVFCLAGPTFMVFAVLTELSQDQPRLDHVLRRQYELLAACTIFIWLSQNKFAGSMICIIGLALPISLFLPLNKINYEMLLDTGGILISIWVFGLIIFLLTITKKKGQVSGKYESISLVGTSIAHELRTPLLSIKTKAEFLARYIPRMSELNLEEIGKLTPRQRLLLQRAAQEIVDETNSASTLIDMLLINANPFSPTYADKIDFSLIDAVEEAISRYPYRTPREKASIRYAVDPSIRIRGPRILLVHVLFNLLKNAFQQFSPEREPIVSIDCDLKDHKIELKVRDNGQGIPEAEIEMIFRRFYSNSNQYGTGVGLSFCRSILREHFSATIECNSVFGKFSEFTISFPSKSLPLQNA